MKIMYCNTVSQNGGAANIAISICKFSKSQGIDTIFLYGRGKANAQVITKRLETKIESYIYAFVSRFCDNDGFFSITSTRKVIKEIRKNKPDIIHIHNAHGYYLDVRKVLRFAENNKIPVVWTLHDFWLITGHCVFFQNVNCNKWVNGLCSHCAQKKEYPKSFLLDRSKSNIQKKKRLIKECENIWYIAPSRWMGNILEMSILKDQRISVIYNGIDLSIYKPRESSIREKYGIADKKIILGVANGWDERKGFSEFVKLSDVLSDKYAIVLVGFLGNVPRDLPDKIIGIPRTSNVIELIEWYSVADVFFNPSKDETFGLVSVEAMACGTPVVAYNICANAEIIDETVGAVCETFEEAVQAIQKISSCETLQYYTECINRANKFSEKEMGKQYVNVYKKIWENRH